jgi:hypothetical protein
MPRFFAAIGMPPPPPHSDNDYLSLLSLKADRSVAVRGFFFISLQWRKSVVISYSSTITFMDIKLILAFCC